eukprot:TRINITY_DN2637_c0_g1_i3.p1 TRINITY_DN2637_c0_g1~~TRINITY_DN2637_c0_g1_i3.p1  ORF type:complete len:138 (+),score=9.23 TRINITY_DN2637_c0_g1_i3:61-414(+)
MSYLEDPVWLINLKYLSRYTLDHWARLINIFLGHLRNPNTVRGCIRTKKRKRTKHQIRQEKLQTKNKSITTIVRMLYIGNTSLFTISPAYISFHDTGTSILSTKLTTQNTIMFIYTN